MKKRFAAVTLTAIILRLALLSVGGEAAEWLGSRLGATPVSLSVTLGAESSSAPNTEVPSPEAAQASDLPSPTSAPEPSAAVTPTPAAVEIEDENVLETTISRGLSIDNATSFDIDIRQLLSEGLTLTLPSDSPQILIVHTHGSEAYTQDPENTYVESDTARTQDTSCSVIRVGDELAAALEADGFSVVHDRGIYDYPSYTGSYNRSAAAVESWLAQYPDIGIVIDLHRDALYSGDVVYKTVAHEGAVPSSQLMLLVGTGENGLYHPNWCENLKLALTLQSAIVDSYPTLARPVAVKQERYNQQLTTGSLILEVGSSGNTLPEAIAAVQMFAKAVSPVLKELIS